MAPRDMPTKAKKALRAPSQIPAMTKSSASAIKKYNSPTTASVNQSSSIPLRTTALPYHPEQRLLLNYDVTTPPPTLDSHENTSNWVHAYLAQEAILPAAEHIVLWSDTLRCKIIVRANTAPDQGSHHSASPRQTPAVSRSAPSPTITVHDVLMAIHRTVCSPLPDHALELLDTDIRPKAMSAWIDRCSAQDSMRCMDVLAAAGVGTRVAGLTPSSRGAHIWNLHFSSDVKRP